MGSAVTKAARDDSAPATPRILDREIRDLDSFDSHTRDERSVAGLLFYKELDCLVDLAHAVALDFFARPQMYRDLSQSVAGELAAMNARYGNHEKLLSHEQRNAIFAGVFGPAAPDSALAFADHAAPQTFAPLRDRLLGTAAAFAERVYDTGADMLRAAVRVMHVDLKNYLEDVSGASVLWSRGEGLSAITEGTSYQFLRNPQIAAVFGVNQPPRAEWPYVDDANGAKLVEEISLQLLGRDRQIPRAAFVHKQMVALRGAEALATVIDFNSGDPVPDLDLLITKCYTWYAARGQVPAMPATAASTPAPREYLASATAGPGIAPVDGNRELAAMLPGEVTGALS
jgi:hypothetical protein